MSSRAGSTILTFLVSIPVAALGLMAVFGVPPLSNVLAAPRGLSDFDREDGRRTRRSSAAEEWDKVEEAPPFEDDQATVDLGDKASEGLDALGFRDVGFGKDRDSDPPRSDRKSLFSSRNKEATQTALEEEAPVEPSLKPSRKPARSGLLPNRGFADVGSLTTREGGTPSSMKEALKKLNMLEVKTYHLKPGVEPDTWLFVCLFTPGDDTRVVQRFEAEEADPELAVNEVLGQIDAWLAQRWKEKQPVARNAR